MYFSYLLPSVSPKLAHKPFPLLLMVYLSALCFCGGLANPPPEIIWLHNGKEIQETEDFHFEKKCSEYSLYIQEVFPEDTGEYTCVAWNDSGEARTHATLTVQGT